MKVSDITSIAGENIRKKYIDDNVKAVEYVPYVEKIVLAQDIVNKTAFKDGDVHFNSPFAYLFYILKLIERWTNIEIDATKLTEEYDALNKLGLVEVIVAKIPESEKNEFDTVYQMVLDDVSRNELSTKYVFEQAIVKLGKGIGEFVTPLIDQLAKAESAIEE